MRYVFWFLFCALVGFMLAGHMYLPWLENAGAIWYGGIVGLGYAVATDRRVPFANWLRALAGVGWIILTASLNYLIFPYQAFESRTQHVVIGVIFAFPAALIWALRTATVEQAVQAGHQRLGKNSK